MASRFDGEQEIIDEGAPPPPPPTPAPDGQKDAALFDAWWPAGASVA